MAILLLGVLIFIGIHLVPSFVGIRLKLIAHLGEGPYMGLYSLLALLGLVLIIYGKSRAEFQPVWEPLVWGRDVVIFIMPVSFILLAAADMKSNVKRFIRHPMMMGVLLWSGAHLLANGDLASIILFGSFAVYAVFSMISGNLRGAATQQKKLPIRRDALVLIAGLVVYTVFIKYLHSYLFGVAIL